DQELRTRLEGLSSPELISLRDELRSEAAAESHAEERHTLIEARIDRSKERLAQVEAERAELGERPRRGRDEKRTWTSGGSTPARTCPGSTWVATRPTAPSCPKSPTRAVRRRRRSRRCWTGAAISPSRPPACLRPTTSSPN